MTEPERSACPFQKRRLDQTQPATPPLDGEAEADEGHFGARHARGRGARGKTIVFGLLRCGGRVCARIVLDATRGTLTRAIEGRASRDPIMCTDGLAPPVRRPGRLGLQVPLQGGSRRERGRRGGDPGNRINDTGSLWGYAKSGLVKHQGMPKEGSYPNLKECELRFNMRGRDMYKFMLRELRKRPLN